VGSEAELVADYRFHKYALFYIPRFTELRSRARLRHEDIERLCRERGARLRVSEATVRRLDRYQPVSLTRAWAAFDVVKDEYLKTSGLTLHEEDEIIAAVWKINNLDSLCSQIHLHLVDLAAQSGVLPETVAQLVQGHRVTAITARRLVAALQQACSEAGVSPPSQAALLNKDVANGETPRAAEERRP
jgi:hypothetical protein